MKSCYAFLLVFIFYFLIFQSSIYADGPDTTPPVIYPHTIKLSADKVEAGEILSLSVKVTDDNSGILDDNWGDSINPKLWVFNSSQKNLILLDQPHSQYDKETNTLTLRFVLDDNVTPGFYKFKTIFGIKDAAENFAPEQDLTSYNLEFEVSNTNSDTTPPVIDLSSIKLSTDKINAGETVSFAVKVIDEGSLPTARLSIVDPNQKFIDAYQREYNNETNILTISFDLDKFAAPGFYKLKTLYGISDAIGNSAPDQDLTPHNLGFEVLNTNSDTTPPVVDLNSIKLSADKVKGGETIIFSVKVTDDKSGVKENNYTTFKILNPNREDVTRSIRFSKYDKKTNILTISLNINKFAIPGFYKITNLSSISDVAENSAPDQDLTRYNIGFEVINLEKWNTPSEDQKVTDEAKQTKVKGDELKNQITTNIDSQPLTPEEKQTLTKNIETMYDLITKKVEKAKTEQDPSTLPKNLALQYCVEDLENFLEQHQSELTRYIAQLQKQGSTGEIDVTQNLHQQLLDLQTIKYVLLMISEAWETYDNENHPNEVGKHETELSRVIASKYDDYIGRKDSQCFKLPEFLDQYEKLVIEQLLKTKSYREKLEKNPEMSGASHPEVIEDLRDVLVPLQSSTTTFWHGNQVIK